MTAQQKQTPALRFAKFSAKWDKTTLATVSEYSKRRINAHELSGDNFVGVDSLVSNLGGKTRSRHAPESGKVTEFIPGDILHSNIRPYLKKAWLAKDTGGASGDVLVIHITKKHVYPSFLYYQITSDTYFEYVMTGAKGAKMPRGDKSHIMNYGLMMPIADEQKKIADFLTTIDQRIELMEKKIELGKTYKKGLIQKLFPRKGHKNPELRFKKEDGSDFPDWQEETLNSLVSFKRGSTLSKSDISKGGESRCIHYGELFTKYSEVIEQVESRTSIKGGTRSLVGDVLMPTSDVTPQGLATASTVLENDVLLGGDINVLRPKPGIESIYLSYQINREKKKIMRLVTGSTVRHVYSKDIAKVKYSIPVNEEQRKIAHFMTNTDAKIDEQERELEQAKQYKKALLQQMFV